MTVLDERVEHVLDWLSVFEVAPVLVNPYPQNAPKHTLVDYQRQLQFARCKILERAVRLFRHGLCLFIKSFTFIFFVTYIATYQDQYSSVITRRVAVRDRELAILQLMRRAQTKCLVEKERWLRILAEIEMAMEVMYDVLVLLMV